MAEVTVYIVQVHGEIRVQADSPEDAKAAALDYWSQAPMNYISVLNTENVLVEE